MPSPVGVETTVLEGGGVRVLSAVPVGVGLNPVVPLGVTLGVALGMALTAASLTNGAMVRNVVLFAVLVYELVGPTLTKRSLLKVGEIKPEGSTSARRHNEPKVH